MITLYLIRQLAFRRYPNRSTGDPGERWPEMDLMKIGITSDLEKRLSSMTANNGNILREECSKEFPNRRDATKMENVLHSKLSDYRSPGQGTEWFLAPAALQLWSEHFPESVFRKYELS